MDSSDVDEDGRSGEESCVRGCAGELARGPCAREVGHVKLVRGDCVLRRGGCAVDVLRSEIAQGRLRRGD